jgi:hypothetical protein
LQLAASPSSEHREPARIKIVQRASKVFERLKLQSPTVTQVGRSFKRPIASSVVVFCNLNRVFGTREFLQIGAHFIIAMGQCKAGIGFSDDDFADTNAISKRSFEQLVDGVRHVSQAGQIRA